MNSGSIVRVATAAMSFLLIAACAEKQAITEGGASAVAPLSAPNASPAGSASSSETPDEGKIAQSQIFPGSGVVAGSPAARRSTSSNAQGDITLNFVNTDIRDVAKAILGDYLKLNYEIAANVQGAVTIQTSQPLTHTQVLPILEQVLRLNKLALVETNGVYKVVAMADARRESGAVRFRSQANGQSGYGIEIVPIRFISAVEMQKLLEPLAPSEGIIHADPARNILILEGSDEERQTLLDDIAMFDTDWMSGMSFALFTPTYMDAEELTKELNQVIGGLNSPISGVVRLVPIDRLNTVMAVSPQPRYLDQLKAWVERLDRPGEGSDKKIFVYHVQNGRASDLAATISKVLFGGSGAQQSPATNNNAPFETQPVGASGGNPQSLPGMTPSVNTAPSPQSPPTAPQNFSGGQTGIAGFESVNITADEVNNALVIAATPKQYTSILDALNHLDTAPVQVFLEAAIAEVTLTNNMQYGLQYFYQPNGNHQIVLSDLKTAAIAASYPGFSYMFSNASGIKVILDALASETHVEVVSSPKVLVLNNQVATLQVGDQVPIATQEATSVVTPDAPVVNSIQYEQTGVILKVTPRVNRGGIVMMDVSQEVSDVSTTTSSSLNSPTIAQRKIASSVAVQDGETIALGGLILNNINRSKDGIPYLQDIPLLGNLFRTTQDNGSRTELMVLITPHVIDNVEKARAITDELRHKLPALQSLLLPDAK